MTNKTSFFMYIAGQRQQVKGSLSCFEIFDNSIFIEFCLYRVQ